MGNQIDSATMQKLYRMSLGLPKIKRLNKKGKTIASMAMTKVRGKQLIAAGQTTEGGVAIEPKKFYRIRKPLVENHFTNMKELFIEGGWSAIDRYVKSVWRTKFYQLPLKKKVGAIGRMFKNLFTRKKNPV